MPPAAFLVRLLARCFRGVGRHFSPLASLANFFYGLLPVFYPPARQNDRVRANYAGPAIESSYLEPCEAKILDRYKIHAGRMLVLGSGFSHKALAIVRARKDIAVFGVEMSAAAAHTANQLASAAGASIRFLQADWGALPYRTSSFDYILLPDAIYGTIAGAAQREAWLGELAKLLKPDGLILLTFIGEQRPILPRRVLRTLLYRFISRLPGTNPSYETGDDYANEHFNHIFQDKTELRSELLRAGVRVRALIWTRHVVVVHPRSVRFANLAI